MDFNDIIDDAHEALAPYTAYIVPRDDERVHPHRVDKDGRKVYAPTVEVLTWLALNFAIPLAVNLLASALWSRLSSFRRRPRDEEINDIRCQLERHLERGKPTAAATCSEEAREYAIHLLKDNGLPDEAAREVVDEMERRLKARFSDDDSKE